MPPTDRAGMRRNQIAVASLLAVIVVAGLTAFFTLRSGGSTARTAPATRTATIKGLTFQASVPAGWVVVRQQTDARGALGIQLSSTGAKLSALGIGPAGTAGVTIFESQNGAALHGRAAASIAPVALLPHVIGTPAKAVSVVAGERPTRTKLTGARAAEEAFGYGFAGRGMMQVDLLAVRRRKVFTIELDAEPGLSGVSQTALAHIVSSWRWR